MDNKAGIHSPEELLAGALVLVRSQDPMMRRAAVLEAITALEAFVHDTVFALLEETMNPLLVKWLEAKSRSDFDSRLGVFTQVALQREIDRRSQLWSDYKRAKEIRNRVTHIGVTVTADEAEFVIDTVRQWLAFLGSTAEVALSLWALKKHIEANPQAIQSEVDAERVVREYFAREDALAAVPQSPQATAAGRRADIVLDYDAESVVVEMKLFPAMSTLHVGHAYDQVKSLVKDAGVRKAALVLFSIGELPPKYDGVTSDWGGRMDIVGIRVPLAGKRA